MRILTHAGQVHLDEIVAIAIIATKFDGEVVVIERRESREVKSYDEYDFVIDTGMVMDGVKFFDHHQYAGGASAAELVCVTIHPALMDDPEFGGFIKLVSEMDTTGPVATAKNNGLATPLFNSLMFMARGIVAMAEKDMLSAVNVVKSMIQGKLAALEEIEAAANHYRNDGELHMVGDLVVAVAHEFGGSPINGNLGFAKVIEEKAIDITVLIGDGSTKLFRTPSCRVPVDFNKSKATNPVFTHKGGFMMVINRVGINLSDEVYRLVSEASSV